MTLYITGEEYERYGNRLAALIVEGYPCKDVALANPHHLTDCGFAVGTLDQNSSGEMLR